MQSRRDLLKAFGTTLIASSTGLGAFQAHAATLAAFATGQSGDAPWCLMAPLQAGANVGKGWRLSALGPVQSGASIMTLTHPVHGQARVHICARIGTGVGLSSTHLLDLVLMDGGDGQDRTPEGLARVVKGISKRIAKNELCAVDSKSLDSMSKMLTHDQRMARFGPENLL
jgi:hypothetical protein